MSGAAWDAAAATPVLIFEELSKAAQICRGASRLLVELGYATLTEVTLATGRRVDILAVDAAGRVLVVEVKSSLADFRADMKWREYLPFCDAFAFATAADFPHRRLPEEPGLIVADQYGAELVRLPSEQSLGAARRKAVILRFARVAAARLQRLADPAL